MRPKSVVLRDAATQTQALTVPLAPIGTPPSPMPSPPSHSAEQEVDFTLSPLPDAIPSTKKKKSYQTGAQLRAERQAEHQLNRARSGFHGLYAY